MVGHGLGDLPLDDLDMVIIENVGNLICPVDFDLGSHMRIVVVSVNDAKRLNPDVQVIKASLKQGEGLSEIISAINKQKDS